MGTSVHWDVYACRECNLELVLLILDFLCAQVECVVHNTGNSGNFFFFHLCFIYLVLVLIAFPDFDVENFKTIGLP